MPSYVVNGAFLKYDDPRDLPAITLDDLCENDIETIPPGIYRAVRADGREMAISKRRWYDGATDTLRENVTLRLLVRVRPKSIPGGDYLLVWLPDPPKPTEAHCTNCGHRVGGI